MVQNVIFDFGRVLIQWDLRHLFEKLFDDAAELEWFLENVVTPEWHFQADAGRAVDDMVAERCAEYPGYSEMIHAYRTRFAETIPGTVDGMAEIVEELAERGVPMFGITNFGAEFWAEYSPTQPLFSHFRGIIVSGQEKLAKPDPKIYRLACARFHILPGRSLFIDDSLPNIESAADFGLHTHHFSGADLLRDELASRGLLGS